MTDRYTKVVLTGIAAALLGILFEPRRRELAKGTGLQMDDAETNKMLSEHLLKAMLQHNQTILSWVRFWTTIQGALVAAYVFVARLPADNPQVTYSGWFLLGVALLLPLFAILCNAALVAIIVRNYRWQSWQVRAYNAIQGNTGKVFPYDGETLPQGAKAISEMPISPNARWVRRIGVLIALMWAGMIGFTIWDTIIWLLRWHLI
jgi:hypothetical protein